MADELVNICPTVPPHHSTQSHDTTPGGGGGGSGEKEILERFKNLSLLHKSKWIWIYFNNWKCCKFFPKNLPAINEHNCTLRESSIGCGHPP